MTKFRRSLTMILCAAMLFALFTGCSDSDTEKPDEDIDGTPTENGPEQDLYEDDPYGSDTNNIDFDTAIAAFPPETIMIKSGDLTLTWAEMYFFLFRSVANFIQTFQSSFDWSEELDDGTTLADLALKLSTEEALTFIVYAYGAKALDITVSDDDLEMLNADIESMLSSYDSKEDFEKALRNNSGFYNFEVFERLLKIEYTVGLIINDLYGDDADSFPDERVDDYVIRNEYMMAKHILRLKTEDDDETPLKESEEILKQLKSRVKDDDFLDFFDELMQENSEDPGSQAFPQGYLFQPAEMVAPFSEATVSLEFGELSDIVESEYGFHIILRLPVDYDDIPYSLANSGQYNTLRQLAAIEDFDSIMQGWRDELSVEYTPEYRSINVADIFAWQRN